MKKTIWTLRDVAFKALDLSAMTSTLESRLARAFGSSRFTKAQQLADPTKPMTRLIKDCLGIGDWRTGVQEDGTLDMWHVTDSTLMDLASEFNVATSRGVRANLIWNHGDPITKLVDQRDTISRIEIMKVVDGRLWFSTYVRPDQAIELSNPAHLVSPRVAANWPDGRGRRYKGLILHVGVVDTPIVDGQTPFIDMSGAIDLASEPPKKGSKAMDFKALTAAISKLLGVYGMSLPASVTEENLAMVVDVLASTLAQANGTPAEEEEPPATPAGIVTEPGVPEDAAMSGMKKLLEPLFTQIKDLSAAFIELKNGGAREKYEAQLTELVKSGDIKPAVQQTYLTLGSKIAWDMSALVGLKGLKMVDLSNRSKPAAKSTPPTIDDVSDDAISDVDMAESVAALGGKPKTPKK